MVPYNQRQSLCQNSPPSSSWRVLGGHNWVYKHDAKQRFLHTFCEMGTKKASQFAYPDIISLQRLLLAFVISRPSSSLDMSSIILKDIVFKLDQNEIVHVEESMTKYKKARQALSDSDTRSRRDVDAAALSYAVLAQLQATHTPLREYSKERGLGKLNADELDASIEDITAYLVDRHSLQFVKTRAHWLEHIQSTEKSKLMCSTRLQAFLRVFKYVRFQWSQGCGF